MKNFMYLFIFLIFSTSTSYGKMELIGSGLLEFSIFKIDVYQITYYKNMNGTEELVLEYKTDVKKKYSIMGWEEGLQHILAREPVFKDKFQWIKEQVVDLKSGDKYTIRKKGEKVTMLFNNEVLNSIEDKSIASMVFEPWIGSKPVSAALKKQLLNIK